MEYLLNLGITEENIKTLEAKAPSSVIECVKLFPVIVEKNFLTLKEIGIKNYIDVFINHTHMFLMNTSKFSSIFAKYDRKDLIRCIEKNDAVIEKL